MELKYLLRSFPRLDRTYEYPEDEPFSVFSDLGDFWRDYHEMPDSETEQPQRVTTVEEILSKQQAWAEQEEAFLRGSAKNEKDEVQR